ncbi:MAG TPA: DUF503 domain-containing protein [Actinomycetota bacterium]|nr:DUF503 domain-containing protein [Actinomycetota bacterium]
MFVGVGRYDFLVPGSTSLKEKRRVVSHITGTMRSRFNVSIAEVDHQDLRQRGTIGVTCISNSSFHAKKMLHEVERFVRNQYAIEVLDASFEVMTPDA